MTSSSPLVLSRHELPRPMFVALARGGGGPPAIQVLRSTRLSRTLLLVGHVLQSAAYAARPANDALAVLAEAQRRSPTAVNELFSTPALGVWAARCVRRLRGSASGTVPLWADLLHIGGYAAVAAMRSGVDGELTTCVRNGGVILPTLGRVIQPAADLTPATIKVRSGRAAVSAAGRVVVVPEYPREDRADWNGVRRLTARCDDARFTVNFDDVDPDRDCYGLPAAHRVSDERFVQWQRLFVGAWNLLVRHAPERAAEVRAGIRTVTPLSDDASTGLSASSSDAFGAVGVSLPRTAVDFAVALTHELQHSKLHGVTEFATLYKPSTTTYHSPWKRDRRPIESLLHGAYAFRSVAELWNQFRRISHLEDVATRQVVEICAQVRHAVRTLSASGALTSDGQLFVAVLGNSLSDLRRERREPRD